MTDSKLESARRLLEKYASIIEVLEKTYSNSCGEASLAEKASEIKIIANRAQELAEKHQFFRLYNAVGHAFEKIETLKNSQKDNNFNLPKSINVSLTSISKLICVIFVHCILKLFGGGTNFEFMKIFFRHKFF